jgi:hypothetical protein
VLPPWRNVGATLGVPTAANPAAPKGVAGVAIGGALGVGVLIFGPVTGASFNRARWLGPAVTSGHFANAWLCILGPLIGGLAAALLYRAVMELDARALPAQSPIRGESAGAPLGRPGIGTGTESGPAASGRCGRPATACAHHRRIGADRLAPRACRAEDRRMATVVSLEVEFARRHRSPWIWVSVGLALAAVGLLIWGLAGRSDLRAAQRQRLDQLHTQVDQARHDAAQARQHAPAGAR